MLLLAGLALFLHRRKRRTDADGEMATPQPYNGAPNMAQMFDAPGESATSPTSASGAIHVPPSRVPTANAFPSKAVMGGVLRTANAEPTSPVPSSQPGSSHLPSVSGTSVSRGTNDENLRSEMVRLRQEVEQLRAAQVPQETPPVYE